MLRPRSGSDLDFVAVDDVLRRQSAEAVVAATGVMVAASLSGIALTAGIKLIGVLCPQALWPILGVALLAVGAIMRGRRSRAHLPRNGLEAAGRPPGADRRWRCEFDLIGGFMSPGACRGHETSGGCRRGQEEVE